METHKPIQQNEKILITSLQVLGRTASVFKKVFQSFPFFSSMIILFAVIDGILPVVTLWISKILIDDIVAYLVAGGSPAMWKPLLQVLVLLAATRIASTLLMQGQSYISARLSQLFTFKMQQEIYYHCLTMDYEFFEIPGQQDKLFRAQSQSAQVSNSLFTTSIGITKELITVFSSAGALLLFSPWLCLIAVCLAVPSLWLNARLAFEYYEIIRRRSERMRKTSYIAGSLLLGRSYARDNILFGIGRYFYDKWKKLTEKTITEDLTMEFKQNTNNSIVSLLNELAYLCAYGYVIWITAMRHGTIGSITMNVGFFANVQMRVRSIAGQLANLYRNSIFLNDYYDLRQVKPAIETNKEGLSLGGEITSIRFEGVSFRYPASDRFVLKDVSFKIGARERICFVGGNGAGKSTLIKLLLRLYDPTEGRILINDRDIRDYSIVALRKAFGVLMQDYSRYWFSVKENIVLGDVEKGENDEDVRSAIDCSGLRDTVDTLPKKELTVLGRVFEDGEDLSGGEWQKLGLARIFYRNAAVVILDEPTSTLDPKMEEAVLEYFHRMTRDKISIIISHRLSSAKVADKIIVVDEGRVVEIGSHAELIDKDGLYAQLFEIQKNRYVGREFPAG